MWDEEDGFYYDVLKLPDGQFDPAEGPLYGGTAASLRDNGDREVSKRTGAHILVASIGSGSNRCPSCRTTFMQPVRDIGEWRIEAFWDGE